MKYNLKCHNIFRDDARQKDVTQIFTAWDGLISSGRATVKDDLVATIVTVTDTLWKEKISYGGFS